MMYIFIFFLSFYDIAIDTGSSSWMHELTTEVIQQYQAPTDILRLAQKNGYRRDKPHLIMDNTLGDFYFKRDASRIVGHKRLAILFAEKEYANFAVPQKYFVPSFDKDGALTENSYVISCVINGQFVKSWNNTNIDLLLNVGEKTGVVDFFYTNIKRDDHTGKNYIIDTQLDTSRENKRFRVAQQLLFNISSNVDQYSISSESENKLKAILKDPQFNTQD